MTARGAGRTTVVTGSASGIGRAAKDLLESRGQHVIGVDLAGADIVADLSARSGRQHLVDAVSGMSGGTVDAVLAIAGVLGPHEATVRVNYFGALATCEGLRPLLARSASPRAVVVSSVASLHRVDAALVGLLDEQDEEGAVARVRDLPDDPATRSFVYSGTKHALNRWIRRAAVTSAWAGAGIALNAIGPGVVETPMTAPALATQEGRRRYAQVAPMPLNGIAPPVAVARLLGWLSSEDNTHVTGQVIFVDGGIEALQRGDGVW